MIWRAIWTSWRPSLNSNHREQEHLNICLIYFLKDFALMPNFPTYFLNQLLVLLETYHAARQGITLSGFKNLGCVLENLHR